MKQGITPRAEDYSQWYQDVIREADLAEHSGIRGCMVIKPQGYAIWESIQQDLDRRIKETGHQNAYFPLFIPKSFLAREARHVEGFALECAVVTHSGLKRSADPESKEVLEVTSPLEEELVVRPTSETIINDAFSRWVQSWRDLPLLINQWANVVRWEMRTRLFLRTTEFLWQEGHTAHATKAEADLEAKKMLGVYEAFAREHLALSVVPGEKTEKERFAGADRTYTIEAMMQDRRALQAGTSHDLGQNFARAFNIKYADATGAEQHVWQTSWGVSTRLIGAVIMAHSDDKGLVLPPRLAPTHVVILPIYKTDEDRIRTVETAHKIARSLTGIKVGVDARDHLRPGAKHYEWEKKGVPIRLELGPRDLEKNQVMLVRRDTGEKTPAAMDGLAATIAERLHRMQKDLYSRHHDFRQTHTRHVGGHDELRKFLEAPEGFAQAHWCGSGACEKKVNDEMGASIRCLPFSIPKSPGACAVCAGSAETTAIFAKAY